MARDYKSRQDQPRRRRHGGGSCFFAFLTGALLGALGVAVAWMMEGLKQTGAGPAEPSQQAAQPKPQPRFDYHSILPEMEVVVPDEELIADRPPALPPPPPPQPTQPQPTPPPGTAAAPAPRVQSPSPPPPPPKPAASAAKDGNSYLLQVGSFKSPADAERLKAKLALLGVSTSIQKVTINGKDTYHRVRAGPYRGKDAANQARSLLSRNGLESMAIKLK
jgi:cell division protein FtsN